MLPARQPGPGWTTEMLSWPPMLLGSTAEQAWVVKWAYAAPVWSGGKTFSQWAVTGWHWVAS
jgi:hypothetical protein